jgi:hypothetical protein
MSLRSSTLNEQFYLLLTKLIYFISSALKSEKLWFVRLLPEVFTPSSVFYTTVTLNPIVKAESEEMLQEWRNGLKSGDLIDAIYT